MKINNKIIFISAALVGIFGSANAQKNKKAAVVAECQTCGKGQAGITVLNYLANEQRQYIVKGCVPGSDVELYSSPSGGEVIATETANDKGEVRFLVAPEIPVSFALNHNRVNAQGIAGNGHIIEIPAPALTLDNFDLTSFAGEVVLRWKAAVAAGDWVFVVQQSANNQQFTDVANIPAREGANANFYDFTYKKPEGGGAQYYRIEARDVSGARVAANALIAKNTTKSLFHVQPTIFDNNLQVTIAPERLPATYVIADLVGRTKYQVGKLNAARQNIQVSLPAAGTYVLQITDSKGISSSEMVIKK